MTDITDIETGLDPGTEAKLDALHAADKALENGGEGVEIEVNGDEIEIIDNESGSEEAEKSEAEESAAHADHSGLAADGAAKPAGDIDSALADLKARLEQAEREKAAFAARERDAEARAQASAAEMHRANLGLIENAVAMRKSALENAKARLVEAKRAQDYESEADIQDEMLRFHAELSQLEAARAQYEKSPPRVQPQLRPQGSSDPVEQMASQMEQTGSTRSAQWIRSHPEYAKDNRLMQKMLAAHNLAVADDLVPDTDAYFAAVESTLGIRKAPTAPPPTPRAAPPPAAPTAASAPAGSGKSNPNRITLTRAEVEIAKELDMTPQEYARNKMVLQKEGKLGK
jgi:hypothetical protein